MAFADLDETVFVDGKAERGTSFYQFADNFDAFAGFVMPCAAGAPAGWLLCDGASYLRADYADLFAAIGTTWGAADGTHFNVPDLRGRTPVGVGTGAGLTARALADSGGEESHAIVSAEMASHVHMQKKYSNSVGAGKSSVYGSASDATPADFLNTANSSGSGTAHQNMQPFLVIDWCIKT